MNPQIFREGTSKEDMLDWELTLEQGQLAIGEPSRSTAQRRFKAAGIEPCGKEGKKLTYSLRDINEHFSNALDNFWTAMLNGETTVPITKTFNELYPDNKMFLRIKSILERAEGVTVANLATLRAMDEGNEPVIYRHALEVSESLGRLMRADFELRDYKNAVEKAIRVAEEELLGAIKAHDEYHEYLRKRFPDIVEEALDKALENGDSEDGADEEA